MRGRKPTPTFLKIVNGNPGKRPLNEGEAKVAPARPTPPAFLSDDATQEWDRVIDRLFEVGLMTDLDRSTLAAYCDAYGRWAQASRSLARMAEQDLLTGAMMIKTKNGNAIQNPLLGIANHARAEMVRFAAEFGMTPSARTRIDVGISAAPSDDEEERTPQAASAGRPRSYF
jgi:P27 family predicted phage terminase small subunit